MDSVNVNVRSNRKIVGIRPRIIGGGNRPRTYDAEEYKKKVALQGPFQDDKQQLKALKDRITVMEQELQKAREESFHAGFEEGRQRGLADASKEMAVLREHIDGMESQFTESLSKLEIPLIKLARKMAERILHTIIGENAELDSMILENLRNGLKDVIDESKVLIRVNPEHMKTLSEKDMNRDFNMPAKMDINVVGDKNLQKGESIIESENYIIDGTYSGQLDHMGDQMIKEASE
jgi:flagellar assembly protein FliH